MDEGLEQLFAADQYSVPASVKEPTMLAGLRRLTERHRRHCEPYDRILTAWQGPGAQSPPGYDDGVAGVPYLPASLFKSLELRSVPPADVFKVMTSSGTTGQTPSRIYLDLETAKLQTKALSSIVTQYLGKARRPMLIVDHPGHPARPPQLQREGRRHPGHDDLRP